MVPNNKNIALYMPFFYLSDHVFMGIENNIWDIAYKEFVKT